MAAPDGIAMQSLQAHMEDMRSLTLCKICLRPFFEPFILGCGHSFCYSCLRSWFGGATERRKNKNCPDCRTEVKVEPAPNYLLREISHLFISRAELLPEDESVAEHKKDQDEESELLSKDKRGVGLFQGAFKSLFYAPLRHGAIHDFEDDVQRCPQCAWEIEEGECNQCGWSLRAFDDFSDSDDDASDMSEDDGDSESLPESDEDEGILDRQVRPQHTHHTHFHAIEIDDDDDEVEDDNGSEVNAYDQHDDFVDDDDEIDMDDVVTARDFDHYPADQSTPYSDAESDYGFGGNLLQHNIPRRHAHVLQDSDEESVVNESEPYSGSVREVSPQARGRRHIVISDDEDEEQQPQTAFTNNNQLFMMPDLSSQTNSRENSDADNSEEDENAEDSESDSDSESEESASDSSSDSSDATVEDNAPDQEQAGDESDDTVIPPQPKRIRQNRLQEHRESRDRRSFSNVNQLSVNSDVARGRLRIARADAHTRNNRRGRLTSVY